MSSVTWYLKGTTPVNHMYNVQVLDKAFMSGVLVMTAFWASAVVRTPPPLEKATASNNKARQSKVPTTAVGPSATAAGSLAAAIKAPFSQIATAADRKSAAASDVLPAATARDTAATSGGPAQSTGSSSGAEAHANRSSLVGVQVLNSLSYLQFCRMRLTAYNTVLKAVLMSVSTSSQVRHLSALTAPAGSVFTSQQNCWRQDFADLSDIISLYVICGAYRCAPAPMLLCRHMLAALGCC